MIEGYIFFYIILFIFITFAMCLIFSPIITLLTCIINILRKAFCCWDNLKFIYITFFFGIWIEIIVLMDVFTTFGIIGSILYSFMLGPLVIQAYVYKQSDAHMGHLWLQLLSNMCFLFYSIGIFKETSFHKVLPMFIANPISLITILYLMRVRYLNINYPKVDNRVRVGSRAHDV